jgi:hypothetical protein
MTTRERVNRDRRRGWLIAIVGFVAFAGGMTASQTQRAFLALGLSGFVVFGASILYMWFSGRCIQCDRPIGRLFYQSGGSPFSISSDLRFCPYCGKSLDEESKA